MRTKAQTKAQPARAAARLADRPGPRRPILSEDVISFTECRGKLGEYLEKTHRTHRPIIVTQNGRPTSVLLSITDWEVAAPYEDLETIELLDDIRVAEEESDRGETYTSDEVRAMLRTEGSTRLCARSRSPAWRSVV